jgi:uncharacterized protein (DUF433 family)
MPRTSTAERNHYICPLCDRPLAHDLDHQGWVRHEERPEVARLLTNPDKLRLMSEEDVRFLEFMKLCPFERGEKDDLSSPPPRYQFLEPRRGSNYRQWFVKGRRIRAEVLYGQLLGPDARTPEELASDYNLPPEAVWEAIEYCLHNEDVLQQDWDDEEAAEGRRIKLAAQLASHNGREP